MKIAFYKSKKRLFNRLVTLWTSGPYSHVEAVFEANTDGTFLCASSSYMDDGVRFTNIDLHNGNWDIMEVPELDAQACRRWFNEHKGQPYDVRGLFSFVFPFGNSQRGWFCSEALCASLGFDQADRFDPNDVVVIMRRLGGKWSYFGACK